MCQQLPALTQYLDEDDCCLSSKWEGRESSMLGVLYICTSSFLGRIVTGQGSAIRRARCVSPRLREFTLTMPSRDQ
jgi:hypothetical protein